MVLRGLALVVALLVLGGCALAPSLPEQPLDWAARDARLVALGDWQLRGRVAVKSERGGGQGDLAWRQTGPAARIRISGPFGAGAWELEWDAQSLRVSGRNGDFLREWQDVGVAEAFLGEQLGWPFPASSSRWWMLGLADPATAAQREFSPHGELLRLEQDGWTVSYERYGEVAGLRMPLRLTLEGAQARLRVVVDRWCLAPDCLQGPPAGID